VLLERYGTAFSDRLGAMFSAEGLPFKRELDKVPNSRRALTLAELARDRGLYHELHPRLFDAYWSRGADLGDEQVLLDEAQAVGLEEDEIRSALSDPAYLERIEQGTDAAVQLGAGGVPAWLVDQRVLVPGAQPRELFDQVLERLGHAPLEAGPTGAASG
jgi:predicted DsbA family dithiol-disulfide isomerase